MIWQQISENGNSAISLQERHFPTPLRYTEK